MAILETFKPPTLLIVFLVVLCLGSEMKSVSTEARSLANIPSHHRYSGIFGTLGIVCKCCDRAGGECTDMHTGSCSNLRCFPWKLS
ncbi:hypothetical protein ACJRO7_008644 [Eucalyptus globulus]|uniref:Uncharacterized protein n=1 Tax=Eucalyptus globulus TaxID=34317 RepID=A0ABD3ISL0_EUCGL